VSDDSHSHRVQRRPAQTRRSGFGIWITDAHRGDGKRFIVRADEMLTAFLELQRAIHEFAVTPVM
jgi:hypothetical protein